MLAEIFLISQCQYLGYSLLDNSVYHYEYSQWTFFPIGLWYVDSFDGCRLVLLISDLSLYLFSVFGKVAFHFVYRHFIYAGCTSIAFNLFYGFCNIGVL